ncbi:MAG: hypothetical protein L0Y58_22200 [Verrucomicrobia subdivision 3 bacterium]|nr:hypothetical protein [Limisphaerales bacterium]
MKNCSGARRLLVSALLATAVSMSLHAATIGAPPPPGVAPFVAPAGGLGIDGDVCANTVIPDIGDWVQGTNAGSGGAVLNAAGVPLNPMTSFRFIDPYGNAGPDEIFVGGLKWTDNPNLWQSTGGKSSSKTDINNVLLHIAKDAEDHIWAAVAADRLSTSGDAYIDFEFLQNPLIKSNANFISYGPHGGRTTNDLLLSLAFTGGGKIANFFAWRWQPNGSGGYAYVDITASLPVGRVFVALNSNSTVVPYGAFGQNTYAPNAFAEAAVDLSSLLSTIDRCVSFGFKTIMVKTKASSSDTAGIEDFIDPIQHNVQIGPRAAAGPDQARCTEGDVTSFTVSGVAVAGMAPIASTSWTVVSGDATIDSASSLQTTARVFSASATLRLTVVQTDGCTQSDDIVLTVKSFPDCSIAGSTTVCPRVAAQFRAPAGMAAYAWTISGNGTISSGGNAQTVTVMPGSACSESFTLTLNVTSNGCVSTCSIDVLVNDTTMPTISCPADLVLECPADTRTNVTGVATAQDGCGFVSIAYSDAVTPGCAGTKVIARTWTATDTCGNVAQCLQTITVRDTVAPTIACPPNRSLECPADTNPAATGVATAQDACGSVSVSYTDAVTNNCGVSKVITRTWTATDECGNRSSCVQTITVRDTVKPTIVCPANVVLECSADTGTNATGVATAQDACGAVTIRHSDAVTENCGDTKVISRTWTATDECGNSVSCVQTITVRDTVAPTINCPPNLVLDCPADTRTNVTGVATAQDVCGGVTITYSDSTTNNCTGTKVIARTWTATDECGNRSSCVQTITVQDIAKPILTIPIDRVLQCPADTRTNLTGVAIATDTCSAATVRYSDVVTTNCGGTKVIARTWTATDQCGNASSGVQTITVQDLIPPTLACPPDRTMECPADTRTNITGVATASDACGSVAITYADNVQNGCGGTKVIRRTWTATDECGNRQTCLQTITVVDTIRPTISVPPDQVLDCPANTAPSATGTATGQDGCGTVTITYSDAVVNGCAGTKTITRTWTATDQCGNSTNKVQMITVRDITPPTLTLPANRVLQCPGDTRTNVTGVATAVDACGSVTITYSDAVTNGCGMTRTVLRTWTATDQCGNATSGLQTINVIDTNKPSITCRTLSVQCVDDLPAPYSDLAAFRADGGTATDTCSSALTFSLVSDSGLVGRCPGRVTRVYRVTDACGNFAECTQTITVDDTIAPLLTCPTNMTVECGFSLDVSNTGVARAIDNCSTNISLTYTDRVVSSEYDLKFYVADPDVGTGPYSPTYLKFGPASLPCPATALSTGRALDPLRNAVAYSTNGQLDALTSIGNVSTAFGQIVPFETVIEVGGGPGPERGTIEFTAAWSTYTTSNNRFGYDTNYMVYCAFVDAADPGLIDPHYNAKIDSFSSVVINRGTIEERIQGTFRVSGLDSGDRVVVEIWVVLMPNMPEHSGGTVAADLVSAQKMTSPPEPITVGVQTDSLGNLSKIGPLPPPQEQPPLGPLPVQPPVPPGGLVTVLDRVWTATDECGNTRTCAQRFTVRDAIPPLLSAPVDLVLECPADTSTNNTGMATAQDDCGAVEVSYRDSVTNGCGGTKVIARTWLARDQYSNSVSAVQTIIVRDTMAPTITCPADVSLDYLADTSTSGTGVATAQDACGAVAIRYSDVVTAGYGNNKTIVRTWTATDDCGYSSSCVQTITVLDPRVVQSTFDGTDDGWLVSGNNGTDLPVCLPEGGQSGGYVSSANGENGTVWYWIAPESYLGDRSANYDGTFQFALMQNGTTSPEVTVIIAGAGLTLVYTVPQPIGTDWTTYTVSLNEIAGWYNYDEQRPATQAEIVQVLSALENLIIKVDYQGGTGSVALDNVVLLPPRTQPSNWLLEMTRAGNGNLRLRWPALATGYILEASPSLTIPNWTVVSMTPLQADGLKYIDLTPTMPIRFFRLRLVEP